MISSIPSTGCWTAFLISTIRLYRLSKVHRMPSKPVKNNVLNLMGSGN